MPACVLYYDEDFEPITVIDVPQWAMDMLRDGAVVRFVPVPPMTSVLGSPPPDLTYEVVHVFAEHLRRKNRETMMLFTRNDTWALRLRSTPLPGQRGDMQHRMREAFLTGFLAGLREER